MKFHQIIKYMARLIATSVCIYSKISRSGNYQFVYSTIEYITCNNKMQRRIIFSSIVYEKFFIMARMKY